MGMLLIWTAVVLAFGLSRAGEWRIHRRNYQSLRLAGADEQAGTLARLYYALHLLLIPVAIAEQVAYAPTVSRPMLVAGLAAILIGQGLRVWTIHNLGGLWTMRCMALPGQRQRHTGPYRWLENPEYLSHIVDGVGLCLLFGAQLTMLGYLVLILAANRRLVAVERGQASEVEQQARVLRQRVHSS